MNPPINLSKIPLFSGLPSIYSEKLSPHLHESRFVKGNLLFKEGTIADRLYIILEGSVQLTVSGAKGQQTVLEILYPGDTFLLDSVLTSQAYLFSAQVLDEARILCLQRSILTKLIRNDGDFAVHMLTTLSGQFRIMVRQVRDLRLRSTTQRLAAYLLELARAEGNNNRFTLPLTKRLMASWLGMSPERLSRSFNALKEFGIEMEGNQVYIATPKELRNFCGFDEVFDSAE